MLQSTCSIEDHHLGMNDLCYVKGNRPIHLNKVCYMNSFYKSTATSAVKSSYKFDPQNYFFFFCHTHSVNSILKILIKLLSINIVM